MANKTVDLNTVIQSVQEIISAAGTSMFKVPSKVNPFDLQNLDWLNAIERDVVVKQMNDHLGGLCPRALTQPHLMWMATIFPRHVLDLTSNKDNAYRGTFDGWVIKGQSFDRGHRQALLEVSHKDFFTYSADFYYGKPKGVHRSRFCEAQNENFERYASLPVIDKALRDLAIQLKLLV